MVVEVTVTASANILTFLPYYVGAIPFQIVNDTDYTLQFKQDAK